MHRSNRLTHGVASGTALLLIAAPLAVGGTRWDAQLVLAAGALLLLLFHAYARCNRRGLRMPWPLWGPAFLVALGLFQVIPLPESAIATLSPAAYDIQRFSLLDLGLAGDGQWLPLSLDPSATWIALFHQVAFVSVFLIAANLSRRETIVVYRALCDGAGLIALIGLLHWALQSEKIFGLYAAIDRPVLTGFFSTFVNNNTLATYLALGSLVGLGLLTRSDSIHGQWRSALACGLAGVGVFLSGSRGGQVAYAIGLALFALFAHRRHSDSSDSLLHQARVLSRAAVLMGAVALTVSLIVLPDWHAAFGDLRADARLGTWLSVGDYVSDFWATGSGRGTFEFVFPRYRHVALAGTMTHPENIFLQQITEWGALGGLVAVGFGCMTWLFLANGTTGRAHPTYWGLVAGLAAVGIQQIVDFGLEAAGLSLPVAAALGVAVTHASRVHPGPLASRRLSVGYAVLAAALMLAIVMAWRGPIALDNHPDSAIAEVNGARADQAAVLAVARRHAPRHPADYMLPLAVAARLNQLDNTTLQPVLRWVNRAIYLFPDGGRAHVLAARALHKAGRTTQSALEYRLSIEAEPWRTGRLVREIGQRFSDPKLMLRAIPPTPQARSRLVTQVAKGGATRAAHRLLEEVIALDPHDLTAHAALGHTCYKLGDLKCVAAQAKMLLDSGALSDGHLLHALLAARQKNPSSARSHLLASEATGTWGRDQLGHALQVDLLMGDVHAARGRLERLWPLMASQDSTTARFYALRAKVEQRLGDPARAYADYVRANTLQPHPNYATHAARAAHQLGRTNEAIALLKAAATRHPRAQELTSLRLELESPAPADIRGP